MDKKITQLTQVTELTGAELIPLAQGGVTKSASVDQLRGYQVYTALLTQSGGNNPDFIGTGLLTIGKTYYIYNFPGSQGYDFTNVGAPNNNEGTSFVATGTTPNSWGPDEGVSSQILTFNTGAPVAIVLENTIGNIWFTYEGIANYVMNSNGLLPNYKTWGIADSVVDNDGIYQTVYIDVNGQGPNFLYIKTQGGDFNGDSLLSNTPIEIRVYN